MSAPPYSIGSETLPGLSRLNEEAGELVAVIGKILGLGHMGTHWDGTKLQRRMLEELSDVLAAAEFFVETNGFDAGAINDSARHKLEVYRRWHDEHLHFEGVVPS